MTRILGAVFVFAMAGSAWAQEADVRIPSLKDPVFLTTTPEPAAPAVADGDRPEFGVRVGYLKVRDAEDGTWLGGIQVRFPLGGMFAIEGSIDVHSSEYSDGDIEVIQWPVQVSLLWFILPKAKLTPYLLGGLGWYYTTTDFSGSLDGIDSDTESMFGAHLGLGARLGLGSNMSLSGDLRYIFLEPDSDELENEDFDTIEFTVSLGFGF